MGSARFSVAAPVTWNLLPDGLRDLALSFDSFGRQLKMALFSDHLHIRDAIVDALHKLKLTLTLQNECIFTSPIDGVVIH